MEHAFNPAIFFLLLCKEFHFNGTKMKWNERENKKKWTQSDGNVFNWLQCIFFIASIEAEKEEAENHSVAVVIVVVESFFSFTPTQKSISEICMPLFLFPSPSFPFIIVRLLSFSSFRWLPIGTFFYFHSKIHFDFLSFFFLEEKTSTFKALSALHIVYNFLFFFIYISVGIANGIWHLMSVLRSSIVGMSLNILQIFILFVLFFFIFFSKAIKQQIWISL